jgi:anthranilate phosphoribosyltransferase
MTDLAGLGGWPAVLGALTRREDLSREQAHAAMADVLAGAATPAQIAALIVGLRIKGEAVDEVVGMVDAMLAASAPLELPAGTIDIVGTGGTPRRRACALNVSTMASIVAAAAGARVCKHGNRRASSTSGSFDLLEALGVAIELDGGAIARCVEHAGVGFCFARSFHPAMRHAAPVRAELGVPTVFNLLGPLSHPGNVDRQVIGVADPRLLELVAGVLAARGVAHALVVHGRDELDELTIRATSDVREVRAGEVRAWELSPPDVGIALAGDDLPGGTPNENARIAHEVLGGAAGPARDIVVLNAAAGLYVAGVVTSIADGVAAAQAALDSGHAVATLEQLVAASNAPA